MTAGQYASLQITKQGVDVRLRWNSPTGESLFTANLESREQGVESLSLFAKSDGAHVLIIEPVFPQFPRGRYQIRLEELRQATEQDKQRFATQQVFLEAAQQSDKAIATEQEAALKKLSESLAFWQSIGDREWEARVLFYMGNIELGLNKQTDALAHLTRALELKRAVGDRAGEAETLTAIGMVHHVQAKNRQALEYFTQAFHLQENLAERGQLAVTYSQLGAVYWRLGEAAGVA
jgi:tetratricopeptide (TPR) repeat protein